MLPPMFSPFPFPSCVSILYLHISVRLFGHDVTDHLITTSNDTLYSKNTHSVKWSFISIHVVLLSIGSKGDWIGKAKAHIKFNQRSNVQHCRNCPFSMVTKNKRFLFIQRKERNSISRSRSRYVNAKNVLSVLYIYIFITLRSSKMLCLRFTLGDTLP